jgi:hypothetical protein
MLLIDFLPQELITILLLYVDSSYYYLVEEIIASQSKRLQDTMKSTYFWTEKLKHEDLTQFMKYFDFTSTDLIDEYIRWSKFEFGEYIDYLLDRKGSELSIATAGNPIDAVESDAPLPKIYSSIEGYGDWLHDMNTITIRQNYNKIFNVIIVIKNKELFEAVKNKFDKSIYNEESNWLTIAYNISREKFRALLIRLALEGYKLGDISNIEELWEQDYENYLDSFDYTEY